MSLAAVAVACVRLAWSRLKNDCFKIFLVRQKYLHDATETLGNSVGLLKFDIDFFFGSRYLQGHIPNRCVDE